MRLVTTYLNERIELLDGVYGDDRADQLSALLRIYNRVLGPVTSVNLVRPDLLDLSLYSAYCHHVPMESLMRDLMVKAHPYFQSVPGGGKGATQLEPILRAFGEQTERLLAILHFTTLFDRLVYATYEELVNQGRRALGPDEMPLFAPEQYADPTFDFVPFRPDTFLGWVEGSELLTGEPVLVPAQLVLMYYKPLPAEPMIGYATTAGLAFHTSRRQAILHGLYEVIERDGVNVQWYSKLPPPHVDVNLSDFLEAHLDVRQARMSTPYIQGVQVFLTSLDTPIPVLTVVTVDQSRRVRAFLGGTGASSQRERALEQALLEVGQSQTALRFENPFGRRWPIYADSDLSEVVEFFDAPLYYGHAKNLPRTFWYTASDQVVPWETVPTFNFSNEAEEFETTISWLRGSSIRPIVLDFDDACWSDASIIKVFVPQLTQACPPSNPFLGHPRFYELPQQLGMADRILRFSDLSPDPIPFA
jgi:ribosomal protein S12 methylthiotransferase accessory factor